MTTLVQAIGQTIERHAYRTKQLRPDSQEARVALINLKRYDQKWIENQLPSGEGIDGGTLVDWTGSTPSRLLMVCRFHHMNDVGMYTHWSSHIVKVQATLAGFDVRVSGGKKDTREYLTDVYGMALLEPAEEGGLDHHVKLADLFQAFQRANGGVL